MISPFAKLPEPTICDLNCFYEPGHEGPHQKWLGAPCDVEGCTKAARWRRGREVFCDDHSRQKAEPSPTAALAQDMKKFLQDKWRQRVAVEALEHMIECLGLGRENDT